MLIVSVCLLCALFTMTSCLTTDALSGDDGNKKELLKNLAKLRHPDRDYSLTKGFGHLSYQKLQTVRFIGRVLSLPEDALSNEDTFFLATVLSILAPTNKNKPMLSHTYFCTTNDLIVYNVLEQKQDIVDRKTWAKWATKVSSTQLRQPWPAISKDKLCEFLFSREGSSAFRAVEAGNILSREKLNADFLKKIAQGIQNTIREPLRGLHLRAAFLVLASAGNDGQKLLLELLPKMPKEYRKLALIELIRAKNEECLKNILDELNGEKWRAACELIAEAGSNTAAAKLFLFAQEGARYDILSYLLNKSFIIANTPDLTPAIRAVLESGIEERLKKPLLEDVSKNIFGLRPEFASQLLVNKLQIAKRLSKAEWFELKIKTCLSKGMTMRITSFDKTECKVHVEFQNKSDETLWINTAALWQAGERIKGQIKTLNGDWQQGGKVTGIGIIEAPREFYPRERDLVEVKSHSSVDVEYVPKLLTEANMFKGHLTITYTNSVDKYFSPEGEKQSLKSTKKLFLGFLSATTTIP